jgi:hypothetical protein
MIFSSVFKKVFINFIFIFTRFMIREEKLQRPVNTLSTLERITSDL